MKYAALLRGINVGGHAKLSMADLRKLLLSLGYTDVATYLQSGNAVFTTPRDDHSELEREIEQGIRRELGLGIKVMIRTGEELAAVVAGNPFPKAAANPSTLHASFMSAQPDAQRLSGIDPRQFEPDEFRVGDRVIYLWTPNGMGRSKLPIALKEQRLGVSITSRNWNTVTKLLSLTSE